MNANNISVIDHLNLPKKGICAFINYSSKHIYLYYSSNCFGSFIRHLKLLQKNQHPIKQLNSDKTRLDFRIIENHDQYTGHVTGRYGLSVNASYYRDDQGYTLYKPIRAVQWETLYEAVVNSTVITVRVILRNGRYRVTLPVTFKNYPDAEAWVLAQTVYSMVKRAHLKKAYSKG